VGKSTISTGPWLQWLYGPCFSVEAFGVDFPQASEMSEVQWHGALQQLSGTDVVIGSMVFFTGVDGHFLPMFRPAESRV